jgi:hypothetical protein
MLRRRTVTAAPAASDKCSQGKNEIDRAEIPFSPKVPVDDHFGHCSLG